MQPPDTLISQAESGDAQALQQLREVPVDADLLRRFAASRLRELQVRAIEHADTPADALDALAAVRDLGLRASLLDRATLPASVLVTLSESGPLLPRILERDDCPVSLLEEAAASHDAELQRLAAEHPLTPDAALDALARVASDTRVQELLWSRAASDPERLPAYARAISPELRTAVALHPEAPPEILADLARDTDDDVRAAVASRSDLDPALARLLASDPAPEVARAARQHAKSGGGRWIGLGVGALLVFGCAGGMVALLVIVGVVLSS